MLKPVYIVCSERLTRDEDDEIVSHDRVIHKITFDGNFIRLGPSAAHSRFLAHVFSLWMAEEEDKQAKFQHTFRILDPGNNEASKLVMEPFGFQDGADLFLALDVKMRGLPIVPVSGVWHFESVVETVGSGHPPVSQRFPIAVVVTDEYKRLAKGKAVAVETHD